MKIVEKITRNCCVPDKDFRPYNGIRPDFADRYHYCFCIHCGQVWDTESSYIDDVGNRDKKFLKLMPQEK